MAADILFRPVLPGDTGYIAAHLRADDRREAVALHGDVSMQGLLDRSVRASSLVWVGTTPGGEPVAMWGVAPTSLLEGIGTPWMLSTEEAYRHPRTLIVEGRRYLDAMREQCPRLSNYVGAWNTRSIRWLKRLGFDMAPAAPQGPAGELFHRFSMGVE